MSASTSRKQNTDHDNAKNGISGYTGDLALACSRAIPTAIHAITDFMDPHRFDVQEREVTWRTVHDF